MTAAETEVLDKTARETGMMAGKRGIIFGLANERSLAWHCA